MDGADRDETIACPAQQRLGLVMLMASMEALALERGRTGDERRAMSAVASARTRANVLQAERAGYSLWVTTAAKGSGACRTCG